MGNGSNLETAAGGQRIGVQDRAAKETPIIIQYIEYFLWLLWESRISVTSALVGILILTGTLQARDLFLEMRSSDWPYRIYWAAFYALLIFGWLLPIEFSCSEAMRRVEDWQRGEDYATGVAQTRSAKYMRKSLPLILITICLAAVFWSQYKVHGDLNLLHEYFHSRNIQDDAALPKVLILIEATMIAFVLFISSQIVLVLFGRLNIRYLIASVVLCIAAVLLWIFIFAPHEELAARAAIDVNANAPVMLGGIPLEKWMRLWFPFYIAVVLWIIPYAIFWRIAHNISQKQSLFEIAIIMAIIFIVILIFVDPVLVSLYAERALLLPIVLGVWVPVFTLLLRFSNATGLPITFFFLAGTVGLSMFNNAHVVSATTPAERERIELSAAINTWKRVNRCAESTNGANCPPLVLIAGQGGASRSAFFTGSVLGHILDENGANSVDRIFAMSGVSGGSVGFAFFSAALFDNQRLGSVSPCRTLTELGTSTKRTYFGLAGFHNWFRSSAYRVPEKDWLWQSLGLTKLEDPPYEPAYNHYWRYCMEVLASGDFLSPVFLKMSGTDFFSLNRVLGNVSQKLAIDRAAVLRRSWEDHYRRITGSNTLTRNFLDFAPSPTAPNQWRPILLMNATSANDGKRVIASHLYPAYCDGNGWRRRIFNDAYDLHEVFSAQRLRAAGTRDGTPEFHYDSDDCKCDPETRALLCERRPKYDFELSTAASLSSRFPVISPQADLIAAGDDNNVRARVVDGGHFENYGASSLLDLVTAIRWIQTELPIHVIMITNDPTLEPGNCLEVKPKRLNAKTEWSPIKDRSNNLPPSEQYRLAPGFTTVFDAALQTRVARGMNAAINLCKTQWTLNRITFTHIGVTRLGIRDISMSWWLSYPVQLYLDSQLAENRESFNFISQILHEKSSR